MSRLVSIAAVLCAFCSAAGEATFPSVDDLSRAVEFAKVIRRQQTVVPNALQKTAVVIKAGGVRCGHVLLQLDDAKGEKGAAYRFEENMKVVDAEQDTTMLYTSKIWLGPDLALLSGQLRSELSLTTEGKQQSQVSNSTIEIKDDKLHLQREEQRNKQAAVLEVPDPFALHGNKPMPKNALFALAAFAATDPNFALKPANSICVPLVDINVEFHMFNLQPAWLTFEPPAKKAADTAMQMKVRYLNGRMSEKGLDIDMPSETIWKTPFIWFFDSRQHVVEQPLSEDGFVQVETVNPETFDANAAIDVEGLRKAFKTRKPEKLEKSK